MLLINIIIIYELSIFVEVRVPDCTSRDDYDVDEFLPEHSDANQLLLKHAGEEAIILTQSVVGADDDEYTISDNDLPSDLLVPDLLEIDEHTDNSSDDDELRYLKSPALAYQPTSLSITGGPISGSIQFKSGHFNRDTSPSSSSDDSISKGLNFKDYSLTDSKCLTYSTSQMNSKFTIPNLVSDLVNHGVEQYISETVKQTFLQDSSDDSEFEILNHEELNQ